MYQRSAPRGAPTCISSSRSHVNLHGRPVSMAAEDRDRLVHAVDLAAEAAADRAADEVQAVRRHRQRLGGGVEREEQRLGRGVAHEAVVDLGSGDGAAGLDRRLLDRRHLIAALDDVVGTREGGLDVAVAQLLVVVFAVIDELVGRVDLAHDGRARLDRLFDVEDVGAHLPVDTDLAPRRRALARSVSAMMAATGSPL